jgi:hypothetical protein
MHLSSDGYVRVRAPEGHPRADHNGFIPEHILVMEEHLGRNLVFHGPRDPRNELAHHKNRNRSDNRIENLVLMRFADHTSLHRKVLAIQARAKGFERRPGKARSPKKEFPGGIRAWLSPTETDAALDQTLSLDCAP